MELGLISKVSGAVMASIALLAAGWKAADYTEVRPVILKEFKLRMAQMESLEKQVWLQRFLFLQTKQQNGGLTFLEQQEMCQIARNLGFTGVPGC